MSDVCLVQDGEAKSFIAVGDGCSEFYLFIAKEVQRYIRSITGATLEIVSERNSKELIAQGLNAISVGSPKVNGFSREALERDSSVFNEANLGPEGFVMKTVKLGDSKVLVVAGCNEAATMYAAYELLECYGVVFEITGDILPEPRSSLKLLELDVKMKPAFKYRGLTYIWNHLPNCQTWSLDDFKLFLDQCAKMKFNYLVLHFFPFEPWLSYSYKGEKKLLGDLGAKETGYTTRKVYVGSWSTKDIQVGREHFKHEWFCSPELLNVANSEEAFRKAQEKLRQIIGYAKSRKIGVSVGIHAQALPPNLAKYVKRTPPCGWERHIGEFVCTTDPGTHEINEIRFRSLVETYPEADSYWLWGAEGVPVCQCEECKALYEREMKLFDDMPSHVRHRIEEGSWPNLKTDIAFINVSRVVFDAAKKIKPDAKVGVGTICRDYLAPYLDKALSKNISIGTLCSRPCSLFGDRPLSIENFKSTVGRDEIIIHRIDDDAALIGMQFNANHFYKDHVFDDGVKYGVAGQVFQLNRTRGMEHNVRYLCEACWNPQLKPKEFYEGYVHRIFGEDCADDALKAFMLLEAMEEYLGWQGRLNFSDNLMGCAEVGILASFAKQQRTWDPQEPDNLRSSPCDIYYGPSFSNWKPFVAQCKENMKYYGKAVEYLDEALAHLKRALGGVRPNGRCHLIYIISKSEAYRKHFETLLALEEGYIAYDEAFEAKSVGDEQLFLAKLQRCEMSMSEAKDKAVETAKKWAEIVDHPCDLGVLFSINKLMVNGTVEIEKLMRNIVNFWTGHPYWEKVDYEKIFLRLP